MKLYRVDFRVFWHSPEKRDYSYLPVQDVLLVAKDLSDVLKNWPDKLLRKYPRQERSGGNHYSTDPLYGNELEYTSITLLEKEVLV